MDLAHYFRSLSAELDSLKDRVRDLIQDQHWPTDGEWKESVLRSVIRRSAPATITIGRGFVVARDGSTSQIDILIYDNSHPVLYRDGDLVFISPAACRGIVEVKSRLSDANLRETVTKLSTAAEFVRRRTVAKDVFVGLFAYEFVNLNPQRVLTALYRVAALESRRVIDHLSLGESAFVKFWPLSPEAPRHDYQSWHFYELHKMAQGYFIHNLLLHLAPYDEGERQNQWFPDQPKELHLLETMPLNDA